MNDDIELLTATGNVADDVRELVRRLGGIERFIQPNERVLIKPACNSPYAFPATTDLNVVRTMVEMVRTRTEHVTVGDSSGMMHKPTKVAFDGMGLTKLARDLDVPLVNFDDYEWTARHDDRATYLKDVHITSILAQFDRLVFLPTMRTHAWARITMALKIGMGCVLLSDRKRMHREHLEEMLGELNLYFTPDLVILDGRQCFINGGPDSGEIRAPGLLLGGTARVALDTAAVRILQKFGAAQLDMSAEDVPMIRTARQLGIA